MKSIHYLFFLAPLLFLGCQTAEISNYVHKETEENRRALQWSQPDFGSFDKSKIPPDGILLIPDFYRFWPEHSANGYFYFAAQEEIEIRLIRVVVSSPGTKERKDYTVNQAIEAKLIGDDIWTYRIRAIDDMAEPTFSNSQELEIRVFWEENNEERESTFNLERITRTDIVWIT